MTSKKGVPRVVWRRLRKIGEEVTYDSIPFLSVSRSLGDFWSFNPRTNHFTVSPKPDVYVHPLNPKEQRFIVIASDGLWNVMTPEEVVRYIWDYEHDEEECCKPRDVVRAIINEALERWERKGLPADNIAVLIAFLTEAIIKDDPPAKLATTPAPVETAAGLEPTEVILTPTEALTEDSPAADSAKSPSPIGKHTRLEEEDESFIAEAAPAGKRPKLVEEPPLVMDEDSGVCSGDDNLGSQPRG